MLDDLALFRGVQRRDVAAWAAFVDRFGPVLLAAVRRSGCTRGEEDEVVQTTWQRLYDGAPDIAEPNALPAWVLRTARREAWQVVRRRRAAVEVELEAGAPRAAALTEAPDDTLARLEQVQRVRDAVDGLGGKCAPLLRALFLEAEADYVELSARLGMPVGSIGPTRQRCLAKLLTELARRGITAEDFGGPRISGAAASSREAR